MPRARKSINTPKASMRNLSALEQKVISLYKQGLPVKQIAKITGIKSMARLYRIIKRHVKPRKSKRRKWRPSPEELQELCRLLGQGMSLYQVSKHFDRSPSTIWHYSRKYCTPG